MAVKEANVRGMMCSYNELNGVPACMSPFLRDLARTTWGFTARPPTRPAHTPAQPTKYAHPPYQVL